VAGLEVKGKGLVVPSAIQHRREGAEVARGRLAFGSEQLSEIRGALRTPYVRPKAVEELFRCTAFLPVPAQQRLLVLDLCNNEAFRDPKACLGIETGAVLGGTDLDILVAGSDRMADEPAPVGMPGDGNLPCHQLMKCRRGDVDLTQENELRDIPESYLLRGLALDRDLQGLAVLGYLCPARLHIERQGLVVRDSQWPRRRFLVAQEVDFVGEADTCQ